MIKQGLVFRVQGSIAAISKPGGSLQKVESYGRLLRIVSDLLEGVVVRIKRGGPQDRPQLHYGDPRKGAFNSGKSPC